MLISRPEVEWAGGVAAVHPFMCVHRTTIHFTFWSQRLKVNSVYIGVQRKVVFLSPAPRSLFGIPVPRRLSITKAPRVVLRHHATPRRAL